MDGPTQAASWRRTAVRPVLDAYAGSGEVDAVMVSGSTARGDADRWSDVEVGVFWSRPPTAEERAAAAVIVRAADLRMVTGADASPPWYDHIYLGAARPDGLMIEVIHTVTAVVDDTLDRVLGASEPDPAGLDVIKGIVDGGEVAGARPDVIARWKARAAHYPRSLAVAVVQRDGAIEKFWRWRMLFERDNPLLLAREFTRIASQLLNVLHALNGRYGGHVLAFKVPAIDGSTPTVPASARGALRGTT